MHRAGARTPQGRAYSWSRPLPARCAKLTSLLRLTRNVTTSFGAPANVRSLLLLSAVASTLGACGPDPGARNSAMALAVIERAESHLFVDASDETRAAIRHAPSGMVCVLPRDGAFDLEVFPETAGNPGAYCSTASDGVAATFVAVRFGAGTTLDRAFADALAASVGQASPQHWSGEPSVADKSSPDGLPHFRIARFEATVNEAPHYLRVAMSEANGWYLQQIVSAPLDKAGEAEAQAGEAWRAALREFIPPAPPLVTPSQ